MATVQFSINLASPEVAKRRKIFRFAATACFILLVWIGADLLQWRNLQKETAALDIRAAQVSRAVHEAQAALRRLGRSATPKAQAEIQEEVAGINLLIRKRRFSWSAFFADLERHVSQDISVRRIHPDAKGDRVVVLEGVARSLPALTTFVNQMQKSESFAEVFLLDQKREEGEGDDSETETVSFSIRFRYVAGLT